MKCPQCNHEQGSGKFCGVCGSPLSSAGASVETEQAATAATMEHKPVTTNSESVEKVKKFSGDYGQGALRFLKRPSLAFRAGETAFAQGLATLIIYMVAYSLSIYFLANSLFKQMGFGLGVQSLPFFGVTSRLFLISLIGIVICLAALFVMARFMNLQMSVKRLIAQYGGLITPFAAINVIAIIFGLSGAMSMTMLLLGGSAFFVLILVPALFIYHHGLTSKAEPHVFYWSTGTSLLIMIVSYLFWNWVISDMLDELDSFLSFF
ncbi:zinc ribbon domain-containing protein [Halobacillus campisalis]|uniref:Zinc ribbon domain-containing protein n=1 Tax=Halobacillus campisalis TaxID=435909 RepID=A0ABW2K1M0_9BACI|nr:zinc ribbon domain-containing protein [Halobacillus campisalis]